jgi:hypothetical protein
MSSYTQFLYQLIFGSKKHIPFLDSSNEDMHSDLFDHSVVARHRGLSTMDVTMDIGIWCLRHRLSI